MSARLKYPGTVINYPSEKNPQLDWFLAQVEKLGIKVKANPCIKLHGTGPDDKRCKHCALCYQHRGKYFKCELRRTTRGPGTDHKANWPTCGKFQPKVQA